MCIPVLQSTTVLFFLKRELLKANGIILKDILSTLKACGIYF